MGAAAINNELVPMRYREMAGLDFKAAIALYGYCSSVRDGAIPLMRILAEKDRLATGCLSTVKGKPGIEIHLLPGAYHAFDSLKGSGRIDLSGNYMKYDARATAKAEELIKEFLGRHLGD